MTPDPTTAASGGLTEDAQAVAKFLLNSGATGAIFEAQGRLLGAVDAVYFISSNADRLREAEIAAFIAGATAVHENYQEDRDPDFSEAAHDYAARTHPSPPSPAQVAGSEAALWRDHDRRHGTPEPSPACDVTACDHTSLCSLISSCDGPARGEELEALALKLSRLLDAYWQDRKRSKRKAVEEQQRKLIAILAARPPVTTDAGAVTREELVALLKKHVPHVPIVGISADMQFGSTADAILARLSRAQADGGEHPKDMRSGGDG